MSKKYNNKYWEYSFFSRFIINYYLISNKLFIYIYISIFIYIITNIKMIDKVESSIDIWIEEFISTTMFKIFVIKCTDVREKKDWREKCYNYNIFSYSSLHLFELIHKFHQFPSSYEFFINSSSFAISQFKFLLSLSLFFFKKKKKRFILSKFKYIKYIWFVQISRFYLFIYISMAIPRLITSMVARFKGSRVVSLCRPR